MARVTIDFPIKSFIEINKILKMYFTEYIITNKMIFGDSLITEFRRMAVITDESMYIDNVVVQPNITQKELNAYRITKDRYKETEDAYTFTHLIEPEKGSDEKFDPYYPDEPHLSIYKWRDDISPKEVYEINQKVDKAWSSIKDLTFQEIDQSVYEAFDSDEIAVVDVSTNKKNYSVIITRQLFPYYDKSVISVAGIELDDSEINHTIFQSQFNGVTIYTLVASM